MRIITGFHAIEEELKAAESASPGTAPAGWSISYHKPGPRVKKILTRAAALGIPSSAVPGPELDRLASSLPPLARDHRGIILAQAAEAEQHIPDLDEYLAILSQRETALVLILDSITDPHNAGAIVRSADQFGVDLVIIPEHRSATDPAAIARTSSGAASWVPLITVPNLVRAAEGLKKAGFWLYGADAGGESLDRIQFAERTALIMGSEGTGIARLLREHCDRIVSIPTRGRLDSLNVSVAAGILLYEVRRSG